MNNQLTQNAVETYKMVKHLQSLNAAEYEAAKESLFKEFESAEMQEFLTILFNLCDSGRQ